MHKMTAAVCYPEVKENPNSSCVLPETQLKAFFILLSNNLQPIDIIK